MSLAEFFGETSNHPGDSAPLQPTLGTLQLLAFPKTHITFEREDISDHWWDSGKYHGAAYGNWENCEVPKCLLWRGLRHHCPMYNVSCIFFNVSIFYMWLDTFWTDLFICVYIVRNKVIFLWTNYYKVSMPWIALCQQWEWNLGIGRDTK